MENTYRDVNIALANEFGRVATAVGVDVHRAIALANHHPRVNILRSGAGRGRALHRRRSLVHRRRRAGRHAADPGRARGQRRPTGACGRAGRRRRWPVFPNPIVVALGLAYKADVDDLRESPSLEIVQLLRAARLRGAPARRPRPRAAGRNAAGADRWRRCCRGADAIVLLTDHAEYRRLHPEDAAPAGMRRRIAIDTRQCLDADLWRRRGSPCSGSASAARPRHAGAWRSGRRRDHRPRRLRHAAGGDQDGAGRARARGAAGPLPHRWSAPPASTARCSIRCCGCSTSRRTTTWR